jgi:raffinose/stachyose/melibiose transport system substrate-binding protein
MQAFQKANPMYKLQVTGALEAQHDVSLEAEASSGTLPDFDEVGYPSLAETFYKNGDTLNLTSTLRKLNLTDKFPASLRSYLSVGNAQYGVPVETNAGGFYVNKGLFAKYGLAVPTTFNQLLSAVKVFHSHGVVTILQGADTTAFSIWGFFGLLDEYGYQKDLPAILSGKMKFTNPGILKFFDSLQQLQQAGAFNTNIATTTYFQALAEFETGRYPLLDSGSFAAASLESTSFAKNIGWFWGPSTSNGVTSDTVVTDASSNIWFLPKSDAKDPAVLAGVEKMLAFLYSNRGQQIRLSVGAEIPTTNYVGTVPASQGILRTIVDSIHAPSHLIAPVEPDKEVSATLANALYSAVNGVMEGALTPSSAAQLVQGAVGS